MLDDEDEVVDDRHAAQGELDRVMGDALPAARRPVQEDLGHAEEAAREVKREIPNVPADRASPRRVEPQLGRVPGRPEWGAGPRQNNAGGRDLMTVTASFTSESQ